jgi:putative acetyltransferase
MEIRNMASIQIRTIKPEDDKTLAQIIRNSLAEFGANHPGTVYYDETTDHLYDLFRKEKSVYYVVQEDGVILGGAGIFPSNGLPVDTCELVKMYLLPIARGRGLASELIRLGIDFARKQEFKSIYLETMPQLKKALPIYEKWGFQYLSAPMGNTGHSGCELWMLKKL